MMNEWGLERLSHDQGFDPFDQSAKPPRALPKYRYKMAYAAAIVTSTPLLTPATHQWSLPYPSLIRVEITSSRSI